MKYFYRTIIITILVAACFYFSTRLFFTNSAVLYNFNFFFGMFIGSSICGIGLYSLSIEYIEVNKKAEAVDDAKFELSQIKQSNAGLQRELRETSKQLDTFCEFQIAFDSFETAIKDFIRKQHQLQNELIASTLKNLSAAQSSETDAELIKRQQAALVNFRQERAVLKEFTSTVPVGDSTLWKVLNNKMAQAPQKASTGASATATSEQKPKKTFVPSPPTRGKRAKKYMRL